MIATVAESYTLKLTTLFKCFATIIPIEMEASWAQHLLLLFLLEGFCENLRFRFPAFDPYLVRQSFTSETDIR